MELVDGHFTNEVFAQIWRDRYQKNGETYDGNLRRVAKFVAQAEEESVRDYWEHEFYSMMDNGWFFPAGRTMSNSGIGKRLTLNNCFTANLVGNSMEEIFDAVKLGAITHKSGGGIGYNFSNLAPKGKCTNNDAIASGPVSFMDVFNAQTATVQQGSRRGANMGVLSVYHPDIYEFLNAKSEDPNRLNFFNLSVIVDDNFMYAVENDNIVQLHWPIYNEDGHMLDASSWDKKFTTDVKARELWDAIMHKAYDNGEPGILFYDNANKMNPANYIETIVGTNPCFTGDMKLLTENGYMNFESLCDSEFNVVNKDGDIARSKVWCNGEKQIVEVSFTNGKKIKCTPDHKFMLVDGSECMAKALKSKRPMPFIGKTNVRKTDFVRYGFLQGDGNLTRLTSKTHKGVEVNIGINDYDIFDLFGIKNDGHRSYYLTQYTSELINLGFDAHVLTERKFPSTYDKWSSENKLDFLKGCYSANGCVNGTHRISYKASSEDFANRLVSALNEFGITPNITVNKSHNVKFKNGEYECKQSYDININKFSNIVNFYNHIGFIQTYKMEKLVDLIKAHAPMVSKVVNLSVEKVYDFIEPETHWGVVDGVVVHNCGEYMAGTICAPGVSAKDFGGACNLGSLMLQNFVVDPFTKNAHIDHKAMSNTITTAVRMLDDIIDINKFPNKIYENYQKQLRTIGIGYTGLADALAMLGYKYSSTESVKFTQCLLKTITNLEYKASVELAIEKGPFPLCNKEKHAQSEYVSRNVDQSIITQMKEYGIRNAKIQAVAPTGTISLTYGNNCSSGMEPIFSLEYDRKVKIGGQDDLNTRTVKIMDYAWALYNDMKNLNCQIDYDAEEIFQTALEMTVDDHIDMLSVVSNYTDMSVSKTINVPTDYPFEAAKNIYTRCWSEGIKGCTIFRPNAIRKGILVTNDNSNAVEENDQKTINRGMIMSVPDDLTYRKYCLKTGCGKLYLFVGIDDATGTIYDCFTNTDGVGGCTVNTQAVSRLISACIRGGIPIEYVIEQLQKAGSCPSYQYAKGAGKNLSKGKSCASAISNVLKDIVAELSIEECSDETEVESQQDTAEKCPECGEELIFEGGCCICKSCGFSRCN